MDEDGKVIDVSPKEGWATWNYGRRDWFQQEVKQGKPYISDSYYSTSAERPMIFMVSPVLDEAGRFLGAVGAEIDLSSLRDEMDAVKAVSQEQSASVQEIASSVESLAEMAEELKNQIRVFKV